MFVVSDASGVGLNHSLWGYEDAAALRRTPIKYADGEIFSRHHDAMELVSRISLKLSNHYLDCS